MKIKDHRNLAYMSPERLHPAMDGNICKGIQPDMRLSSESLMKVGG